MDNRGKISAQVPVHGRNDRQHVCCGKNSSSSPFPFSVHDVISFHQFQAMKERITELEAGTQAKSEVWKSLYIMPWHEILCCSRHISTTFMWSRACVSCCFKLRCLYFPFSPIVSFPRPLLPPPHPVYPNMQVVDKLNKQIKDLEDENGSLKVRGRATP